MRRQSGQIPTSLEARAAYYFDRLHEPAAPFRYSMLCEEIASQFDLFYEEHFEFPDVRRLQLHAFVMANKNDYFAEIVDEMTNRAPVGKLLGVIALQATADRASLVSIVLDDSPIRVDYDGNESMTIPASLRASLLGHCRRAEALGFARWRTIVSGGDGLGSEGSFSWNGSVFEITLAGRSGSTLVG